MSVKNILLGLMITSGLVACEDDKRNYNENTPVYREISDHEVSYTESSRYLTGSEEKYVNITKRAEELGVCLTTVYDLDDSTLMVRAAHSEVTPEVVYYTKFSKRQKAQFDRVHKLFRSHKP